MHFGYARISTPAQDASLQHDALRQAGCERIFTDTASGAKADRPELTKCLEQLRTGDTLYIWKLDRLGRSLKHLVQLIEDLNAKGIGLVSINDPIDTTTAQGRLVFNIFASLAEFERELIRERTQAGLKAARARGRKGGRPAGLTKAAQQKAIVAETLYKQGELSVTAICEELSISRTTFYKYLRHRGVAVGKVG